MAEQPIFRRIVLGLSYHQPNLGVRLAAEIAALLQLDLFGLFVEEKSLFGLAALPFARELTLLGGGWRPLGIDEISRDLEMAAKSAERSFADAAKTLQTTCQFEVVRGSMAESIASISRASDIIVLAQPESPAALATSQSLTVVDAALQSAAAVLLVPGRIARHSGAVVAIARQTDDISIEVAKAIATAAKEELIIIEAFESAGPDLAPTIDPLTKSRVRRISLAQGKLEAAALGTALAHVRERLIVVTRSDKLPPWSIASIRQVPILVVEPPRAKGESGD